MSLFNLVHQSVVLKFTDAAKPQFDSATSYVFRLTGVDGMGFLQIQDVRLNANDEHETLSEPFWINKDMVSEIREYASATGKDSFKFSGGTEKVGALNNREAAPKPAKKTKAKAV